eukprot:8406421-Pyramimonas_sp.AAC.1
MYTLCIPSVHPSRGSRVRVEKGQQDSDGALAPSSTPRGAETKSNEGIWGVECTLAVIGTGGPVK